MLRPIFVLFAASSLVFTSCSSTGTLGKLRGDYTSADLATLRLRDINPLANTAPVVKVNQATLQEISEERLAQIQEKRGFLWFRKPVNWTPPTLPEGSFAPDGSLLPPKEGSLAVLNVDGYLPENHVANSNPSLTAEGKQDFSIE